MCEYCEIKNSKNEIAGKEFKVNKTLCLREKLNTDNLICFILKGKSDKQAGIMIGTFEGYHYININYCPMCRKKISLGGRYMKFKDIKCNIKYKFQRAKKGYCDQDLFSIDSWFMETFPKMLNEFVECTCGRPCDEKELIEEASKIPSMWKEQQRPLINKILKKYDDEFDLNDPFCCWLLIILRMKYCFEMCDEWHKDYKKYWDKKEYEILNNMVEKHKKEAFYLFEKYFFNLWW